MSTPRTYGKSGPDDPAVLYRLFDVDGALLYIGVTADLLERLHQHEALQPWWADVASVQMVRYARRKDALADEWAAIQQEDPVHVHQHPSPRGERKAVAVRVSPPDGHTWIRIGEVSSLLRVSKDAVKRDAEAWGIRSKIWQGPRQRERRYCEADVYAVRRSLRSAD